MPSEKTPTPSRYMKLEEVAAQLGFKSRGPIYDLVSSGALTAVNVAPASSNRPSTRVVRASFEAYCQSIEAAAAEQTRRRNSHGF